MSRQLSQAEIEQAHAAYADCIDTSLGRLSASEWQQLSAHWSRFSAYSFVKKLGRKWTYDGFGLNGPLFTRKRDAALHVSNLLLLESKHRKMLELRAEYPELATIGG